MITVSHIVNSVFSSRTYMLANENKEVWLVDCGDVSRVLKILSSTLGSFFLIKGVLLTHAHFDHFYGLPYLAELYPKIKVYTDTFGRKALGDVRLNLSKYHDSSMNYESANINICYEGSVVDLFEGVVAKVYSTPGHNPSCLTYEIENYLLTGDAYIPGKPVVTTLPNSNKELADQSLNRLKAIAKNKIVCPGHEWPLP